MSVNRQRKGDKMPKFVTDNLMHVLREYPSITDTYTGYKPITDERVNAWLCKHFGLNTSDNDHEFDGFKFRFNWNIQVWYVMA
jgi:hypothetical protein